MNFVIIQANPGFVVLTNAGKRVAVVAWLVRADGLFVKPVTILGSEVGGKLLDPEGNEWSYSV